MVPKTSVRLFSTFLLVVAALSSCSTTRVLEEGQFRLAKNEVKIKGDKNLSAGNISNYIQQKANSYIVFGWSPSLNLYNLSGRDTSKFVNRLIRKMGDPPVVYEASTVAASVKNIDRHMEYLGYYNSDVESEVKVSGKKVKVIYTVTPGHRYKIGKITYSVPEGEFGDDFMADTLNLSIKPGDYLSEATLESETERSASWMRRNGWFGFTKNYYSFEADTLARKDTADLRMIINEYTRNQSPENTKPFKKYSIGDVSIAWDKELPFNDRILKDIVQVYSVARQSDVVWNRIGISRKSTVQKSVQRFVRHTIQIKNHGIHFTRMGLEIFPPEIRQAIDDREIRALHLLQALFEIILKEHSVMAVRRPVIAPVPYRISFVFA